LWNLDGDMGIVQFEHPCSVAAKAEDLNQNKTIAFNDGN
jgi:hypothetical protein